MVDLTKKKTATEYPTAKLLDADTVFTYRPTNAVGEKVFRGIITEGTAASIATGTSTDLKMYSDSELKSAIYDRSSAFDEVWTGTATSSLDLTAIPGRYPGDGLYVLTFTAGFTGTIHFIEGEVCFNTIRGVSGNVEVSKNASELLSINGTSVAQIRRFRP